MHSPPHPPHTASHPAIIAITVTRRTLASSENRESLIRQQCGGQIPSSIAEVCSAPVSSDCVEDVHSFGITTEVTVTCTHHETSKLAQHITLLPRIQSPSPTSPHTASHPAIIAIAIIRRTPSTSKHRESFIRQRCGGQVTSSLAKNCSAPVSRDRIEDVHSVKF